jgi:signal transduction histidine kinase
MTSPEGRRIALASTISSLLIAGAIGATIWSFEQAGQQRVRAETAVRDTQRAQRAATLLGRERQTMAEYVLGRSRASLRELSSLHRAFDQALSKLGVDSSQEDRLVKESAVANARLLEDFRMTTNGRTGAVAVERLDASEVPVASAVAALGAVSEGTARKSDRAAGNARTRALVAAVLAGLIALGAGLVFARYALRLVRRVTHQNEELQQLDQLKDGFVASVSHELRTPLTSIKGYLELVLDGEAGEVSQEQEQFLRVVERNADRLLGLVGDLLFVAQLDAGRLELELSQCDLAEIIEGSLQGIRPFAEANKIELVADPNGSLPISGDTGRLAQLADNLLSNAVKFTPAGGRVRVATRAQDDSVYFEVADSGIGIAPGDRDRLFERFFRASSATERAIQGTGLGLSIAKAIVDAHHGELSFESVEGKGTTFRVRLPSAAPTASLVEQEAAA